MNSNDQLFSLRSGFPTFAERLCLAFVRIAAVLEVLTLSLVDCFELRPSPSRSHPRSGDAQGSGNLSRLARDTTFTVNDVQVLYELFKKVSNSVIEDSLIHKEELRLALLQTTAAENLLLDRVFDLFDENNDGVIEFEEFVRSLSVFHPFAPMEAKTDFAFRLYDLKQTGYIERDDVKRLVVAILMESEMKLSDEFLEAIIDKTFEDADLDLDGRISRQEWKAFVTKRPSLLKNMTLPYLRDLAALFPSHLFDAEVGNAITSQARRR